MLQKIGILIGFIGLFLAATRYWSQFREWQKAQEKKRKREMAREAQRAVKRAAQAEKVEKRSTDADELVPCPRCGSFVPSGKCDCNN